MSEAEARPGRRDAVAGPGLTEDRLKAVAATAASAGGVALFHVVGVTPEAPELAAVLDPGIPERAVPVLPVTAAVLRAAPRDRLDTATGDRLDAVSLGTPHFSVTEFAALAGLLGPRRRIGSSEGAPDRRIECGYPRDFAEKVSQDAGLPVR